MKRTLNTTSEQLSVGTLLNAGRLTSSCVNKWQAGCVRFGHNDGDSRRWNSADSCRYWRLYNKMALYIYPNSLCLCCTSSTNFGDYYSYQTT